MKNLTLSLLCLLQTAVFAQNPLQLVADLKTGNASSNAVYLGAIQDKALLVAETDNGVGELLALSSSGGAQTLKVLTVNQIPQRLRGEAVWMDGVCYFLTTGGQSDWSLWASDGTAAGTITLKIFDPYYGPQSLAVFDHRLWFPFEKSILAYNLLPGTIDTVYTGGAEIERLTGTDDYLYWFEKEYLNPYVAHNQLRRSNGQPGNVSVLKEVGESISSTSGSTHIEKRMLYSDGRLNWSTFSLGYYNGGTYYGSGMAALEGFPPFTSGADQCILATVPVEDRFYLFTVDHYKSQAPPYEQNRQLLSGTANGTYTNVLPASVQFSLKPDATNPGRYLPAHNFLYFSANESGTGTELYRTDGTAAGTYRLQDLFAGTNSSNPYLLDLCGSKALFLARDVQGYALWMTDSAATSIEKIAEMPQNYARLDGEWGQILGNTLFLNIFTSTYGFELWMLEGLPCGATVPVIQAPDFDSGIQVQPNPGTGKLAISLPGNEVFDLSLFDFRGARIGQQRAAGSIVWDVLEKYPAGLYLLHFQQADHSGVIRIIIVNAE